MHLVGNTMIDSASFFGRRDGVTLRQTSVAPVTTAAGTRTSTPKRSRHSRFSASGMTGTGPEWWLSSPRRQRVPRRSRSSVRCRGL
jgi:hypothetical protein